MTLEESLGRADALVGELEATEDAEQRIELLTRLDEAVKEVLAEIERARREAGAGA